MKSEFKSMTVRAASALALLLTLAVAARAQPAAASKAAHPRMLIGERDPLARMSDEGYRDHADDMTLEVVSGANHFMPEELPQQTADRILQFLA